MNQENKPSPQFERDPFPKMIIIVSIISVILFMFVAAMLLTDLANRHEERFVPPVGDDAFDIPDMPAATPSAVPAAKGPADAGALPQPPPQPAGAAPDPEPGVTSSGMGSS